MIIIVIRINTIIIPSFISSDLYLSANLSIIF
jgi:hypothetical protein